MRCGVARGPAATTRENLREIAGTWERFGLVLVFAPTVSLRGAVVRINDYCEERIARYLELAEAAQDAAGRASNVSLEETYAQLARQWIELARMAERTIVLVRGAARPIPAETLPRAP